MPGGNCSYRPVPAHLPQPTCGNRAATAAETATVTAINPRAPEHPDVMSNAPPLSRWQRRQINQRAGFLIQRHRLPVCIVDLMHDAAGVVPAEL